MKSLFLNVLLCLLISAPVYAGTITVAQDGSGNVTSVQLAVATASNGDEIVILDSAVYNEDLIAGAAAGMAAQFTLKAAEGQTPTIRATNTSARMEDAGIIGLDLLGAIFFGCVGVEIEGITFENQTTDINSNTISSALSLIDSINVTVRNCTIKGAGGPGTGYAGFNFGTIVYGATLAPKGIVYENCLVEECHFGIQVLKVAEGVPVDPSVTIRGCTIQNCNGNGIEMDCAATPNPEDPSRVAAGEGHLIENTRIINCQNPATLGGGKITLRHCTILGNRGYINVDKQDSGELPILADFDDVAIIGSEKMGIRVIDGKVNLSHCIIAGCYSEGLAAEKEAEEAIVTVDHCDFYQNLSETADSYELRLHPATVLDRKLTVTNTNIIGIAGIFNGDLADPDYFEPDAAIASYCNVVTEYENYLNVTADHGVSLDPAYVNPTIDPDSFTRAGFQLKDNSSVLTAASDGSYIGSQGPVQVTVSSWMVF